MKHLTRSALLSLLLLGTAVAHADDSSARNPTLSVASLATALPAVAQTASTTEAFDPDAPKLDTEITRTRYPNVPLLTAGSTLFALTYLPAVIGAAVSDRSGDDNLYIPIAGPFMAYTRGDDERRGYKALLVADGVLQSLGGLAILGSFLIPEEKTRKWRLFGRESSVGLAPQVAWHSVGVGAHGRF